MMVFVRVLTLNGVAWSYFLLNFNERYRHIEPNYKSGTIRYDTWNIAVYMLVKVWSNYYKSKNRSVS